MSAPYFTNVTQYWVDTLNTNKFDLGLQDVYYGDQVKIPRTPAVAVDTGDLSREIKAVQNFTEDTIEIYFLCYLSKVKTEEAARKQSEVLLETVLDFLDKDTTAGGNVIYGYVTRAEPGYVNRSGILMRSARVTWQGLRKKQIGV